MQYVEGRLSVSDLVVTDTDTFAPPVSSMSELGIPDEMRPLFYCRLNAVCQGAAGILGPVALILALTHPAQAEQFGERLTGHNSSDIAQP